MTALHQLGRHEEALRTMEHVMKMLGSDTKVQHWHERAKFEVRKQRRTDYYALLQVPWCFLINKLMKFINLLIF